MKLNPVNIFKFLEKKEGRPIPVTVKPALLAYTLANSLPLTPEELNLSGNLDLKHKTKINSLPDDLKVSGELDIGWTGITSLPDNLKIGGSLYIRGAKIDSLPNGLQVNGNLYLNNTPISKEYTNDEIRKIINDKGGKIGGRIYD
jgi:hypothetical protein